MSRGSEVRIVAGLSSAANAVATTIASMACVCP